MLGAGAIVWQPTEKFAVSRIFAVRRRDALDGQQ
jgi:hypothetical protein